MVIEKRIKLGNAVFLLGVEIRYRKQSLVKKDGTYFDMGDFSALILDVENNYQGSLDYDKNIGYMNDIIYLYDRFPFVNYIKDITYDKASGEVVQIGCISREEIVDYINDNGILIGKFDGRKSVCPLLYETL